MPFHHPRPHRHPPLPLPPRLARHPRRPTLVTRGRRGHEDGYDPQHGGRAAESLIELAEEIPNLAKEERELLAYACTRHSDGLTEAELTVQVCWDADRLDLGRVGHRPDPKRLCTPAAKDAELIEWAYRRSR
ncbi:MAG: hypothetical protein ACT4P9_15030 [Betaproteobacteria bacterium]